jgi:DNA-binding transcriptional MerR regulator
MKALRTSDLARAAGVHPNTVRRYADWGLIPPVERGPNGYRRFTRRHLDCLRLARLVLREPYSGRTLRQSALRVLQAVVSADLQTALEQAHRHRAFVQAERAQANIAARLLERWASAPPAPDTAPPLQIGQAAELLGVSIDVLRNWDRSGLLDVPRDPANGYRRYGAAQVSRLRVIRMLSRAGYSLSAILRMLVQLDRGQTANLRQALDTPRPDEDVYTAFDRWLSTLAAEDQRAAAILALVEDIVSKSQQNPV